jgi:uncharacterized protein YbaR (Trm112 family)
MRIYLHRIFEYRTTKGYPLIIRPTTVIIEEASEVDVQMVQQMLTKIDYDVLKQAYQQIYDAILSVATTHHPHLLQYLPATLPDELPNEFLIRQQNNTTQPNDLDEEHADHDPDDELDETDTNITTTTTNRGSNATEIIEDHSQPSSSLLYKTLFCVLFEIHIMEGILICPDTQREFPIKDGIPNMILHEDEL